MVEPGQRQHRGELRINPQVRPPRDDPGRRDEREAERPGRDHRRIRDQTKQLELHRLEHLGHLAGPPAALGVVDKDPRQVEQPRHPGDHGHDMQRLGPGISRRQELRHVSTSRRQDPSPSTSAQARKPSASSPKSLQRILKKNEESDPVKPVHFRDAQSAHIDIHNRLQLCAEALIQPKVEDRQN